MCPSACTAGPRAPSPRTWTSWSPKGPCGPTAAGTRWYNSAASILRLGSGGVRASRVAAGYGARVAIAESDRFGGTCVNVGCIPKKLFSYAAHLREDFEVAKGFGWTVGEPVFDWQRLLANKDREILRLNGVYERVLALAGVEIMRGRATVRGPHDVESNGKSLKAKHILIATGSWPVVPENPRR